LNSSINVIFQFSLMSEDDSSVKNLTGSETSFAYSNLVQEHVTSQVIDKLLQSIMNY
jgi:hypothetical protein